MGMEQFLNQDVSPIKELKKPNPNESSFPRLTSPYFAAKSSNFKTSYPFSEEEKSSIQIEQT